MRKELRNNVEIIREIAGEWMREGLGNEKEFYGNSVEIILEIIRKY